MSTIKTRLLAGAAALTLIGGAGALSASTTWAATPSCGHTCVEVYTRMFGPEDQVDVLKQKAAVNQEIILYRTSNTDPALDFTPSFQGTVHQLYLAKLVSAAFALHYGGGAGTRVSRAITNDPAFELEYTPDGTHTGLCLGTWPGEAPAQGFKVRLEACGVGATTIWAVDSVGTHGNAAGYANLIDGADMNFSEPFVLTYPGNANPVDSPRPWVQVQNLAKSSDGTVPDNQQWSACLGVVGSSSYACAGAGLPGGV